MPEIGSFPMQSPPPSHPTASEAEAAGVVKAPGACSASPASSPFGASLRARPVKVVLASKKKEGENGGSLKDEAILEKCPALEDPGEQVTLYVLFSTYVSFGAMAILSFIRDWIASYFYREAYKDLRADKVNLENSLFNSFKIPFYSYIFCRGLRP
jgi:hypothetical protein